MEEEIKSIYFTLTGGKSLISADQLISKKHFNSISSDRFTSELKKRGIVWNGNDISFEALIYGSNNIVSNVKDDKLKLKQSDNLKISSRSVGIDIQEVNELPDTIDYWEDEFYKQKFSKNEIAYCLSRNDPKLSFCGLYSSKESIIKADNDIIWDEIEILFDANGKPYFRNFEISISHSQYYAISIAIISFNNINNSDISFELDQIHNDEKSDIALPAISKSSFNIVQILFYFIVLLICTYLLIRDYFLVKLF